MPLWWEPCRGPDDGKIVWYAVVAKDWFLAREALSALTGTEADPCTATGWRKTELGQLRILADLVQHVLRKQRARDAAKASAAPRTDTPGADAPSPTPRTTP